MGKKKKAEKSAFVISMEELAAKSRPLCL